MEANNVISFFIMIFFGTADYNPIKDVMRKEENKEMYSEPRRSTQAKQVEGGIDIGDIDLGKKCVIRNNDAGY